MTTVSLTIKSFSNNSNEGIRISVDLGIKMEEFYRQVAVKLGVPVESLMLVYAGKPLKMDAEAEKNKLVEEMNFVEGSTLFSVVRVKG